MKARVKATGEIKEVTRGIYSPYQYVDNEGTIYTEDQLEELSEDGGVIFIDSTIDYWTRLEHQYAGMAMQGMLSNTTLITVLFDATKDHDELLKEVIICSHEYAHALVEKMRKNV